MVEAVVVAPTVAMVIDVDVRGDVIIIVVVVVAVTDVSMYIVNDLFAILSVLSTATIYA